MLDSEYSSASLKSRFRGKLRTAPKEQSNTDPPKPVSTKAANDTVRAPGYMDGVQKATKAKVVCVHCRKGIVNRPKGLCWSCYYAPGVRELYPSTSRYARRGVRNFSGVAPLADKPTREPPGTVEKLAVMEERAKMSRALFHPADARYLGDQMTEEWLAEYERRLQERAVNCDSSRANATLAGQTEAEGVVSPLRAAA